MIVPEYCPLWHERIERVLDKRFPGDERFELNKKVLHAFDEGMCSHQAEQAIAWMNDCVSRIGLSRSDLAEKMDVDRAHIGRWLTGENDLPFRRLQRFYVMLGLRSGAGMPLKESDWLHFGGYARAVGFLNAMLTGNAEDLNFPLLDLETLLCVYQFYATMEPFERFVTQGEQFNRLAEDALADVRKVIDQYVLPADVRVRSATDLIAIVTKWGTAWLMCLQVLAQEEDGIREHYVSAKRGIRLTPVKRGDVGTR